jgi:hypothetical protein
MLRQTEIHIDENNNYYEVAISAKPSTAAEPPTLILPPRTSAPKSSDGNAGEAFDRAHVGIHALEGGVEKPAAAGEALQKAEISLNDCLACRYAPHSPNLNGTDIPSQWMRHFNRINAHHPSIPPRSTSLHHSPPHAPRSVDITGNNTRYPHRHNLHFSANPGFPLRIVHYNTPARSFLITTASPSSDS